MLLVDYYENWVDTFKDGAVRKVTLKKYHMVLNWLKIIAPTLDCKKLDRNAYQRIINEYAKEHEKQTVLDFHHMLKGAVLDAVDDDIVPKDPTRRVVIKGKQPRDKKQKFLNQFELQKLLDDLKLDGPLGWDHMIMLIAKTGLRFSEALGLTPADFDFKRSIISVNKTWDYKHAETGEFVPTKNASSVRKVPIDWLMSSQFAQWCYGLPPNEPIFVPKGKPVYNSTINGILMRHCKRAGIPVISVHGLRHTHASILLYSGVSTPSVSQRLGHSSIATTQKTYLHIIHEMENRDVDLVMRSMSSLSAT